MEQHEITMVHNAYLLGNIFGHKWAECLKPTELAEITSSAKTIPQALAMIESVTNMIDPINPNWPASWVGIRRPGYNGNLHHRSGSGTVAWSIGPRKTIITVRNILIDDVVSGALVNVKKDYGEIVLRMDIGTKRPFSGAERIAYRGKNYAHDKSFDFWFTDEASSVKTVAGSERSAQFARQILEVTNVGLGV